MRILSQKGHITIDKGQGNMVNQWLFLITIGAVEIKVERL